MNRTARTTLPLLTLALVISPCFAQSGKPPDGPPPAPATQQTPEEWKPLTSNEGRFSVLLPGTPVRSARSLDTEAGKLSVHSFSLRTLPAYSVEYTDFPVSLEDPHVVKQVLDNGRDSAVENVKGVLLEENDISLDGHPGRYVKVRTGNGNLIRSQIYVAGSRAYALTFVTSEDGETDATRRSYEEAAARFFGSFKLLPAGAAAGDSSRSVTAAPEEPTVGPSLRADRGAATEEPAEGEVDRLLKSLRERHEAVLTTGGVLNSKALSKPAPEYPPIARAARARGVVAVRVVVDEQGGVIAAQAQSGHPLLQPSAVRAARAARFPPTMLGGRRVKVSGVVTYNFMLP